MSIPTSQATQRKEDQGIGEAIATIRTGVFASRSVLPLSDLSQGNAAALARHWPSFPLSARIAAVTAMTELAEDQIELIFGRALRVALRDESPIVRQLAVDGLWEDEGGDLSRLLLQILHDDDSPDVRAAAAQGLGRFAVDAAAHLLDDARADEIQAAIIAAASDPSEPYIVRRRALESAGVFGKQQEVADLIRQAYASDDPGLQAAALYAMGRSLDEQWLDLLSDELENEDAEMRYEAARAVGEIGDDQVVPGLATLTQDEDAEVRQAAIIALGRIGGRAATRVLQSLGENAPPADLEAVVEALEEAVGDALP